MIDKFNPFQRQSSLFPIRWFIVVVSLIGCLLLYSDLNALRLFSGSGQQKWSATGPRGYHK